MPVLRAFLLYFKSQGIQKPVVSEGSEYPVGALALAAAAVSRSTTPPHVFTHFFPGRTWIQHAPYR